MLLNQDDRCNPDGVSGFVQALNLFKQEALDMSGAEYFTIARLFRTI
jgi:hypothetical protein